MGVPRGSFSAIRTGGILISSVKEGDRKVDTGHSLVIINVPKRVGKILGGFQY